MEDDFDLDLHRKEQEKNAWFRAFRQKSKKLVGILKIVIAGLAFVVVYLIYKFATYHIGLWTNDRINETARDILETPSSPVETPYIIRQGFSRVSENGKLMGTIVPEMIENVDPQDILGSAPRIILPEIEKLRQTFDNQDIVGYIKIEGTNIDFPVAHTKDNSFYLDHDLKKQSNVGGSAFLDFENASEIIDPNNVIYAHNMKNGSMFHNLRYYKDRDFYESHKKISLQTMYENTEWEIFSFYETEIDFFYNKVLFSTIDEYEQLVIEMRRKSQYDTGINVYPDNQILTLSTCAPSGDLRLVVHAKRIEN
jgi:SrtB family sortase